MYSYYKLTYVAKLRAGSTASAYNQNIDKYMATCNLQIFYYEIFVHQFLRNFCAMKIWCYTEDIHKHDTDRHSHTCTGL